MNSHLPKKSLLDHVRALGLSHAEALIYVHMLERGTDALVSKIALGTKMHRQQVYATMPALLEHGLVEVVGTGRLRRYRARPPRAIERFAERKVVLAESVVRELETISKLSHEQDFEVVVGREACRVFEVARARRMAEGSVQYIIGTEKDEYIDIMGDVYSATYAPILKKKKVETYYLAPESQKDRSDVIDPQQRFHLRVLSGLTLGPLTTLIQGDLVVFFVNVTPPSIYVIKSQKVAEGYQSFFTMLWNLAKEPTGT